MTRREARETALQLIYERSQRSDEDAGKVYDEAVAIRELHVNEYISRVYFGVGEHIDEIDGYIRNSANDWSVERMSRVTVSILRLAVYELYYEQGIPKSVSINEAIELAKIYDDDGAPAFINGILNKIAQDQSIIKEQIPHKK